MKKLFLIIILGVLCFTSSAYNYQNKNEKINYKSFRYLPDNYNKGSVFTKSTLSENPYKLDSIIYTDGTKEVFEYNDAGRTTQFLYYEKSESPGLQLTESVEYEYTNDRISLFRFSGLVEENKLSVKKQSEMIYDSNGRMTTEIHRTQGENELVPFSFYFSTHSPDSSVLTMYKWDANNNNWDLTGYEISYYDNTGTLKQLDTYKENISSGVMELSNRILFQYDYKGRSTGTEFLAAPYTNGIWEREMAFYYEYNNNDQIIKSINYMKTRGLTESWYEEFRYYNENGFAEIIDCFYGTDSINNSLEYKIEYQYENNSLSVQLESMFDKEAGELKPLFKYELKHDTTIDTTGLILPSLEGPEYYYERNSLFSNIYFKGNVLKSFIKYEIDTISNQFVKKNEASYYYSRLRHDNTSSIELTDFSLKCSPNPFTDNISISLNEKSDYKLKIYDLTGRLKYSDQISGSNFNITPDINERGIYILELSSGKGKTYRTKIIRK
jgi:hypothetical protein